MARTRKGAPGAGLMSIGKSRAKPYIDKDTGVTFDDVAGVDEAKEELKEIIDYLQNPQKYQRLGGKIPKGCCWWGPQVQVRRCLPGQLPVKRRCLSFL